ncbi:Endonuclease/exonuclease/phosphatase superfamily [Arabidopsis thaliana x Arabidopsis arenosa]|uniref:Endonuclease/exonuclease/phosphatase superfamily n=2 Tax=Arabidopsis TaxID=3701 RepID=A0A8T1Y3Z1_9BRAS|nr:Endonuclease/exonuclease/phosphatase superfamily [Arabidopsis thaliana x Arabidopsis arenosa]
MTSFLVIGGNGGVKKPHRYRLGTIAVREIHKSSEDEIRAEKNPRPFDEDDIALVKNYKFKLWRHVTEAKKKHSEKKMTKSDEPKPKRLRIAKDTKKSSSTLNMPKRPLTGFFIFVPLQAALFPEVMSYRIPYSAKGKGIAYPHRSHSSSNYRSPSLGPRDRRTPHLSPRKENEEVFSPPPRMRIRAPVLDTSDLIEENSLTLMGRLTNPSVQRLWSLIPFLSNRWNLRGKATGSDLGRGCFQFRFEFEEDLQKVLDNRPYHFDQWMVILQRWEPVISPTFPSKIPFWIDLQGLPKHYWKQQMVYKIGEELGEVIDHELSSTAAKIKVLIDGLKPLTKETVVDFPDGTEALVTLEYKGLKNHCKHCHRLSHDKTECPGLKSEKESSRHADMVQQSKNSSSRNHPIPSQRTIQEPFERNISNHMNLNKPRAVQPSSKSNFEEKDHRSISRSETKSHNYYLSGGRRSPPRRLDYSRKATAREKPRNNFSVQQPSLEWREKTTPRELTWTDCSENSRTRRPPLEKPLLTEFSSPPPRHVPTTEEVMDELREVTVQYTSCADPTESLARKQRVLQGEARGLMTDTAAQIISAASLQIQSTTIPSETQQNMAASLSPDLPIHPADIPPSVASNTKRKRGRPPINRQGSKSPLRLTGAKSSKRNKVVIQNSPKRRTNSEETILSTRGKQGKQTKQKNTSHGGEAGNPMTVRRLKEMHSNISPDIIFLMETKNSEESVIKTLQWMGYSDMKLVSPHSPGGGGLALLWNQTVSLQILSECHNFIDTRIEAEGKSFFATFIYGEPDQSKRKEIWTQLSALGQSRSEPWFLTGDFNDIIDSSEKLGGPARPEGSFVDFRTFMSECDLFDLRHSGNFLSWRGKRHEHLVFCRLDRAMSNSEWAISYPAGRCEYLDFEGSDHRPIATYFDLKKKRKKGLFRYDRRLRNNEEVTQLIYENWQGALIEKVDTKISRCRSAIIKWSRKKHLNSQEKINLWRGKLEVAMTDPNSEAELLSTINEELKHAYKEEEEFWKQRSRQLWLSLGDKNSGYFHAITKGRRAINKFSVIEDDKGGTFFAEQDILKVITDYYNQIFTAKEGERLSTIVEALQPKISEETNIKLTAIPSANDIRLACFSIHADKAPGPDGFSASFFQTNWETVGKNIILEIQGFFSSGILPKNLNATHVRLIPKIKSPRTMKDYRPIALCSVYYKIIAKLLTKRLQPILHDLISENQSAFVPQRAISDNVLITHEALHYLHTSKAKKKCYMAVKTDMSKAYDRIEWEFIRMVMERLGFSHIWISWIMQCISTVSYSYLLNGEAQGLVIPQRGIRQGDPLSPFIFILCSEVLSGLCHRAEAIGTLTGIKLGKKSPRISHLLFADDTMFFCKAESKDVATLLSILQKYESASGQMINPQKSAITFSAKTVPEIRERIKSQLGIQSEGGLGKYLGLPELFGRKKKDLFTILVDRIRQRACSWSSKFLSAAGKLVMLKAVLAAMPTYTMSCFQLPQSLCKRIQSALTRFWWDTSMEKKKMCWVSWKNLTKSRGEGGLGFRDIQSFNDALLAKISWRILTKPSCLLARILLGKYCHSTSFLASQPPANTSHGWRGICAGKDLLKKQLGRVIGNGKQTSLWYDPWLSTTSPITPMGPPQEDTQDLKVAYLISSTSLDWDREKIQQTIPELEKQILEIRLSKLGATDSFAWLPTKTGLYSAKSGYYETIKEESESSPLPEPIRDFQWTKNIWHIQTSPKTKFFLWKAMRGALPTGDNLSQRRIYTDAKCPFCGEEETTFHLLYKCSFAAEIWEKAPFKASLVPEQITSLRDLLERAKNLICLPPCDTGGGPLFPWILWSIWLARNHRIFKDKHSSPRETLSQAIALAREWNYAQTHPPTQNQKLSTPGTKPTSPNDPETTVCHTDAAWNANQKAAGFGWVFSNCREGLLREGSECLTNIRSPLLAEAIAIYQALLHASEMGIKNLSIASDSKQLIEAILSETPHKDLHGILHDILVLSSTFQKIRFSFVSRNVNRQADALAKRSLLNIVSRPVIAF